MTPKFPVRGYELRTGLNIGASLFAEVDGSNFTELSTIDFLLARTLLKAPLAITILKNPGLRTTPTVVPLINTQLAAILGHRGVTLRVTPSYR